jgi:4-hydroxy-tetrahydrodipicolinate reductase
VAGSTGRMGRTLLDVVGPDPDLVVTVALEHIGHPLVGQSPIGANEQFRTPILIRSDHSAALSEADVLIDFTRPEGTLAHLESCAENGVAAVIGTTGFSEQQVAEVRRYSEMIPIVLAPNMAVGVNAAFRLAGIAAKILGAGFDVEIIEAHHRHKVDAPSGTALKLGEVIAAARGQSLHEVVVHGRKGNTGERERSEIGFHAIRGGDIVGEHTVLFAGDGERVEITVRSSNRNTYAQGAVRAAKFLAGRTQGLYDMADVLGLRATD